MLPTCPLVLKEKQKTMSDNTNKLTISPEDFDVIEAALHTQSQILNVQARAGGPAAQQKLNEVKRVLNLFSRQKPSEAKDWSPSVSCWLGMSRIFS